MRSACCLCVSPINFWMAEPIFMKLGTYFMEPEPISTAYIMNPSHHSVGLYVYTISLLGNGSVKTLPQKRTDMQQYKTCWTYRFLRGPCRTKGKYVISSSQNFLFILHFISLPPPLWFFTYTSPISLFSFSLTMRFPTFSFTFLSVFLLPLHFLLFLQF
jgi:hypothetical protein